MQYRRYGKLGYEVSLLGFGAMRMPRLADDPTAVDKDKAIPLIQYAADHGVTYFDTAYGYHNTTSEAVLGEALEAGGRRGKVKIVTKQPFNVMTTQGDIRKNLENTLKKLRTSYLDVYLIHNIQASTWEAIKERKIIEEYEKFRAEGLIKAIGFSYHGKYPVFKEVLGFYDWGMCQMQQNFLDIKNEATVEGMRRAGEKGCALVIMEPLRGGGLATPPPAVKEIYDSYRVKRPAVEWAFRHLADFPEVSTILSGITTMEQMKEDIEIFSKPDMVPGCLSNEEKEVLTKVRAHYESLTSIPCTACEYCLPCPKGVNIPGVFSRYNEGTMFSNFSQSKRSYFFLKKGKQDASFCAACAACEKKCPQHIGIIEELKTAHRALDGWVE
ncbi:MAG: aldo/keto reductase [Treponema sp.]|jgi:predicted aldo/keto reductase-like oxidoreductase|nr:aldo/keto reductase [Treponema sp.]